MIKELLKPDGIYSMRRFTMFAGLVFILIMLIKYISNPSEPDANIITGLTILTTIGTTTTAFKK